jgi:hypothetical protein
MTAYALDHVAIAVPDWRMGGPLFAERLGGQWLQGVRMPHMNVCQLGYANTMRVELLEPGSAPNSFVSRFLRGTQGTGRPHHLTFKVTDIGESMAAARRAGIEPVLIDVEREVWREAFLHPRDTGLGVLVQLVESSIDPANTAVSKVPAPWEYRDTAPPAEIPFVLLEVGDTELCASVLSDVLGGVERPADVPDGRSVRSHSWKSGADIVLASSEGPSPERGVRALGVRPSRLLDMPARPVGGGFTETPRIAEVGLSLLLPTT